MEYQDLSKALSKKAGLDVVSVNNTGTQLRIIGRVHKPNMRAWLITVEWVLVQSVGRKWSIDFSKQYFMRGQKLAYGWRVILQAPKDLSQYYAEIVTIISSAPAPNVELDEVSLHAGPNRNALHLGKGAQPTLSAVVGPLAARQLNTGG